MPGIGAPLSPPAPEPCRALAHELNSLLDGSMRWVGLADRALVGEKPDDARDHLARARAGLFDMAEMLRRALLADATALDFTWSNRRLDEELAHQVGLATPLLDAMGVTIEVHCEAPMADLTAGPLGTVVLNALRNAVAACRQDERTGHHIVVSARRVGVDLMLEVTDTGVGPGARTPDGSGIGLQICAGVVGALGGRLALGPGDGGHGARLRAVVPMRALVIAEAGP